MKDFTTPLLMNKEKNLMHILYLETHAKSKYQRLGIIFKET